MVRKLKEIFVQHSTERIITLAAYKIKEQARDLQRQTIAFILVRELLQNLRYNFLEKKKQPLNFPLFSYSERALYIMR